MRRPGGVAVALVGCGSWAETAHLPALRSLAGVRVVGCVGAELCEAEAFAARHHLPLAAASLEELLESGRADAVVVAAPDHVHEPAVLACIEAGTPVYCEKPLANSVGGAERLLAAQARRPVRATVGFCFRYSPAVHQLRADLGSGRLGEPWLIELREYNSQFHPASGSEPGWKRDPARAGGGALFEYGSHALDLAQLLAGPVLRVSAQFRTVLAGSGLDDIATVQLEHESGCLGTLVCGWVLAGGYPGIAVRVHGSKGAAELELSARLAGGERYRRLALDGSPGGEVALPPSSERFAYVRRHLADFLSTKRPPAGSPPVPAPSLADGADVQRVLAACLGATDCWCPVERPAAVQRLARQRRPGTTLPAR